MCNDRCPKCDHEIVPTMSTDLRRPLTKEDFGGAAKLFHEVYPDSTLEVSPKEAREYAEGMLEGGEDRFREGITGSLHLVSQINNSYDESAEPPKHRLCGN